MHRRRRARANSAISREQVIRRRPPGRLANQAETFRSSAAKHVTSDPITPHQPSAGLPHGVEPLEPQLQPCRELLGRWVLFRILRQQQAGFQVGEPRRHHEVIGGDLQLQRARVGDEHQILLDQLEDRNLRQIHLLRASQAQQQVERPLPRAQTEG